MGFFLHKETRYISSYRYTLVRRIEEYGRRLTSDETPLMMPLIYQDDDESFLRQKHTRAEILS